MNNLHEIESAVEALPIAQQEELLRHLAERLHEQPRKELKEKKRSLPLVPPSGNTITQENIDDALDAE